MEKQINFIIVFNYISVWVLIAIPTLLYYNFNLWHADPEQPTFLNYIYYKLENPELLNLRAFFSFYLICTMLTPVDIIATVELVKVLYAQHMECDAWSMSGVPDGVGGL